MRADQAVLFLGSAQTRKLHLSFAAVPSVPGVEEQEEVAAAPVDEPPRLVHNRFDGAQPGRSGPVAIGFAAGLRRDHLPDRRGCHCCRGS